MKKETKMHSKSDIKKTTDWLKKNGTSFDVYDGGIHIDGGLTIPQGSNANLPALVKSGSVYVSENATLTAPALRTIGNVAFNTKMFGHTIEVHDGIGSVVVSEKERDRVIIRRCKNARFKDGELIGATIYVVSQGEHNSHGDTLSAALADLAYKTADRDTSQYQNMPMDTEKTPAEWAVVYRIITGTCQSGTENFIKIHGDLKDTYTLAEIIELTRGAYGGYKFRECVQ